MTITGTGFRSGTTVTFGGERVNAYAANSTTLYLTAPAHAAGAVDVVVSWPNGESTTRARGFTYAPPQSFDFNGTWVGYALAHPPIGAQVRPLHSDMDMCFTVENNMVTSFNCGGSNVDFAPAAVSNGEFSLAPGSSQSPGASSPANESIGTINTPRVQRHYGTRSSSNRRAGGGIRACRDGVGAERGRRSRTGERCGGRVPSSAAQRSRLTMSATGAVLQRVADADGRFVFLAVTPGEYVLAVWRRRIRAPRDAVRDRTARGQDD